MAGDGADRPHGRLACLIRSGSLEPFRCTPKKRSNSTLATAKGGAVENGPQQKTARPSDTSGKGQQPDGAPIVTPELATDIAAAVLRQRLDATLAAAIERQRVVYKCGPDDPDTLTVCDSFRQFVALCERMEATTGAPCHIDASW